MPRFHVAFDPFETSGIELARCKLAEGSRCMRRAGLPRPTLSPQGPSANGSHAVDSGLTRAVVCGPGSEDRCESHDHKTRGRSAPCFMVKVSARRRGLGADVLRASEANTRRIALCRAVCGCHRQSACGGRRFCGCRRSRCHGLCGDQRGRR